MKTVINTSPRVYTLQTLFRDVKIVMGTAVVTVVVFSFYVKSQERYWKSRWSDCLSAQSEARLRSMSLEICKQREGRLYEIQTPDQFIESVRACSSNSVNNVYYTGTSEDFDYFVHNCDFLTRRIRVCSSAKVQFKRMPLTDDVSCWIQVAATPVSTASDLSKFLNGGSGFDVMEHP